MSISVQTNMAALTVLQNLNKTAGDNSGAQTQTDAAQGSSNPVDTTTVSARGDLSALSAAMTSLDRASSIADVSLSAGDQVADLLGQLKDMATAASDPSMDASSRATLNSQFQAVLGQITQTIQGASVDGTNLLDGSSPNGVQFQANAQAGSTITLSSQDMSLGGSIVTLSASDSLATADSASQALDAIDTSIANVGQALTALGGQAKQITSHNDFLQRLTSTLQSGVGDVDDGDDDDDTESLSLQALQVQQQLGSQSLSIANQAPQLILSLFKGS